MAIIKQLCPQEAQKIAAGQVVERPADILKELIENSIDAQASSITVCIEDGGKNLIRVVDNGWGMDEIDAHLCFQKHTTSKITALNDLSQLTTFGFRGEALASIAAVAKVRLVTKQSNMVEGIELKVEENRIISTQAVPASVGTDLSIYDLFYTIPVRKKFLKQKETEWRHILHLMQAFSLSYPHISFKLNAENKVALHCPSVSNVQDRFIQIWDHTIGKQMLSIDSITYKNVTLKGNISDHQSFRFDRNSIFIFVNNRWIKDFKLTNALIKGYMNSAPVGKYPIASLSITIDPSEIDVNIHPRKEEIRFTHPRIVENLIQDSVKNCLEKNVSRHSFISPTLTVAPATQTSSTPSALPPAPSASYKAFDFDATFPSSSTSYTYPTSIQNSIEVNNIINKAPNQPTSPDSVQTGMTPLHNHTIIGQYQATYILIEQEEGLFIIDQHAAHERILYEQFGSRFSNASPISLIFPLLISLSLDDLAIVESHTSLFAEYGIGIDIFGHSQIRIQSTPSYAQHINMEEFIRQVLVLIKETESTSSTTISPLLQEKVRAQMACKAAVKAGDILSTPQMEELCKTLSIIDNRLTCPHGRPTGWLISLYELEKKFKRKN